MSCSWHFCPGENWIVESEKKLRPKLGGAGKNFELLQDTRDAFFFVHRNLGLSAKENYSAILIGSDFVYGDEIR